MTYGDMAIVHCPDEVEEASQKVWYQVLPSLKVNRDIWKEWRMLPIHSQGLELPNPNIDILCSNIHMLQSHWFSNSVTGNMLCWAYQVFHTETGLGGNIFARSYDDFESLASHGWFKHFWHLCDRYQVVFRIAKRFDIPLLQEDDKCLMDAIANTGIYTSLQLRQINGVRKFKKVHCVGDILLCDGRNVNPRMLTDAHACSGDQ